MHQTLRKLIADGKTKDAIAQFLSLNIADKDLYHRIIELSARYKIYERQKLGNLEDPSVLRVELASINHSLLAAIDELEGSIDGVTQSHTVNNTSQKRWLKIGAWLVAAITLLASLAEFTGWNLKSLFEETESSKVETKVTKLPERDTVVLVKLVDKPQEPKKSSAKATEPKARNVFQSFDSSKQINLPDNKGPININQ